LVNPKVASVGVDDLFAPSIRAALTQAMKWGLVPRNAATLIDPPRQVRHRNHPASTRAGATASREAAGTHRLGALITVALAVGLRQGEALGLKWDAVDLDATSRRPDGGTNPALPRLLGRIGGPAHKTGLGTFQARPEVEQ